MGAAKPGHRQRHQRRAGGRERGHPQPPGADPEHGGQVGLGGLHLGEDRLRVGDQRRARPRSAGRRAGRGSTSVVPVSASSRAIACETADCV